MKVVINQFICAVFLLIYSLSGKSQEVFQNIYKTPLSSIYATVHMIEDSNYLTTGWLEDFNYDFISKIGPSGNVVWTKYVEYNGLLRNAIEAWDEGIIISGNYNFSGHTGDNRPALFKLDDEQNIVWVKTYGVPYSNTGNEIIKTLGGGYAITGDALELYKETSWHDIYFIKTNNNGDPLIMKAYGSNNFIREQGIGLIQLPDSGYFLVGISEEYDSDQQEDILVLRLDKEGNLIWSNVYGGSATDVALSITQLSNSTLLITGSTRSFDLPKALIYLINIDLDGNVIWEQAVGDTNLVNDEFGMKSIPDPLGNGAIVLGNNYDATYESTYLFKVNLEGDIQWAKEVGTDQPDGAYDFKITKNNEYVLAGDHHGEISASYLIKTNEHINTTCNEAAIDLQIYPTSSIINPGPDASVDLDNFRNEALTLADLTFEQENLCYFKRSPLVADFSLSDSLSCGNNCAAFIDNSKGDIAGWEWLFPGGTPSSSFNQNPGKICYSENGVYDVTLIVHDDISSDTFYAENVVTNHKNQCELFFPNAFSPDSRGVNDLFKCTCKGLDFYELNIYDRYGKLIYFTNDYTEGWNGKNEENLHVEGVYMYSCKYSFQNDPVSDSLKLAYGNFTLLR